MDHLKKGCICSHVFDNPHTSTASVRLNDDMGCKSFQKDVDMAQTARNSERVTPLVIPP